MRLVILHNRDFRGVHLAPVVGASGKRYGTAKPLPGRRILEFRLPFDQWSEIAWDIALGGRRAGYTYYVADIIEAEVPAAELDPAEEDPNESLSEQEREETPPTDPKDPFSELPPPGEVPQDPAPPAPPANEEAEQPFEPLTLDEEEAAPPPAPPAPPEGDPKADEADEAGKPEGEPKVEGDPAGEPKAPQTRQERYDELNKLRYRSIRSVAQKAGIDVDALKTSDELLDAIMAIEFPE